MGASIFDTIAPKMMARIQALRLMDDDFMTVVFGGNKALTEFLLSHDDLRVKSVMTQTEKRNLFGRSVRLDIVAKSVDGTMFNIEIQRADRGALRAVQPRMLDSHTLNKNDDFSALPETYIIFITENDYFGFGQLLYKIKKTIEITTATDADFPFDDGCTTLNERDFPKRGKGGKVCAGA